jgi:hypothetical protein
VVRQAPPRPQGDTGHRHCRHPLRQRLKRGPTNAKSCEPEGPQDLTG